MPVARRAVTLSAIRMSEVRSSSRLIATLPSARAR